MLHEKLNLIVMKYNYHFLKERYLGSMGEICQNCDLTC